MEMVARWTLGRFFKLRLWIPAVVLPALLYLVLLFLGDDSLEAPHLFLLGLLLYMLPALAIVSTLTAVDRSQWVLWKTTRLKFSELLGGYWLGGSVPFIASALILTGLGLGIGSVKGVGETGRVGIEYDGSDSRRMGIPGQPMDWNEAIAAGCPWTLEWNDIDVTASSVDGVLDARLAARFARQYTYPELGGETRLEPEHSIEVEIRFPGMSGEDLAPPIPLELRGSNPTRFSIPGQVVRDGHVVLVVHCHEPEHYDDEDHDHHHEHGDEILEKHDHGVGEGIPGPAVLWFVDDRNHNGVPETDVLIVRRPISFLTNFGRAGILAAFLIPLVVAMATFAAALFRRAIALAFSLTLYVCGVTMTFLHEITESLELQSAAAIFGVTPRRPTWIDQMLKGVVDFWLSVLPDFEMFSGSALLSTGEAVQWGTIAAGGGLSALYVLAFLALAMAGLWRWEVTR